MLFGFAWSTSLISSAISGALASLGLWLSARWRRRDEETAEVDNQRESRDLAREEAMDLARVRGDAIEDLHRELSELKTEFEAERAQHLDAIGKLQAALDLSREQSLETQQMLAHGVHALLVWILRELENDPPHVDVAVRRIREAIEDADPRPPGQRRTA